MHPIERLRYVARSSGAPQQILVEETAAALTSFGFDPQGLVTACRRMIARQPSSAPLVWLAARLLTSGDPRHEARLVVDEIAADPTGPRLGAALPVDATVCVLGWPDVAGDALLARGDLDVLVVDAMGEGSGLVQRLWRAEIDAVDVPLSGLGAAAADADVVVIEASAIGPDEALVLPGSRAAAAVACHAGVAVWLVGGVGRLLPQRMWDGLRGRTASDEPWDGDEELIPLGLVSHLVGSEGPELVADGLRRVACPVVPELFGTW